MRFYNILNLTIFIYHAIEKSIRNRLALISNLGRAVLWVKIEVLYLFDQNSKVYLHIWNEFLRVFDKLNAPIDSARRSASIGILKPLRCARKLLQTLATP